MSNQSASSSPDHDIKHLRIDESDDEESQVSIPKSTSNYGPNSLQQLLFVEIQKDDDEHVFSSLNELLAYCQFFNFEGFVALGGHTLLVVTMKKWEGYEYIQAACCRCLNCFFQVCPKTHPDSGPVASSLVQMGLADLLCAALTNHSKSPLAKSAISVLAALMKRKTFDDAAKALKLVEFLLDFDGMGVVLKEMEDRPYNKFLQADGCYLLIMSLGSGAVTAEDFVKSKGLVILATALQDFTHVPEIKEAASFVLKSTMESMQSGRDVSDVIKSGLESILGSK